MIPRKALEMVDKILCDCCNIDHIPFAGKSILLGEDFRQILPVVKNGTKFSVINETLKFPSMWSLFHVVSLKTNMRAGDKCFSDFEQVSKLVLLLFFRE